MTGCGAGLSVYLHFFPQRRLFTALRRFLGGGKASDGQKGSSLGASAGAPARGLRTRHIPRGGAPPAAGGAGAAAPPPRGGCPRGGGRPVWGGGRGPRG